MDAGIAGMATDTITWIPAPAFAGGRLFAGMTRHRLSGRLPRNGISLIEVMVAMMVALIGVFGVLILIPFAVRQVEIGMNLEAAQTLARNAISDFDAQGLQDPARWAWPDTTTAGAPFYDPANNPPPSLPPPVPPARSRQVFCIDPWGWTLQGLLPGVDPEGLTTKLYIDTPYTNTARPTNWPVFPRLSLFDRGTSGTPDVLSLGLARRIFSAHGELLTQVPIDDLSGPTQLFFQPDGGRQYAGKLSWRMFVVQDHDAEGYARFYVAVSLHRVPETTDRVFEVNSPGPYAAGGDLELNEMTTPPDSPGIRRGQWIMLVDGTADPPTGPGNKVNDIAFFRVLESDQDTVGGPHYVTVQGSDFTPEAGSNVYAVLIPDVIAVYERTMKHEASSNWSAN
jgi:type II secretory pathway pseudopilin PulG